jgi:hypothetical protein
MKKLIIGLLVSPVVVAHSGHDHVGLLAHGAFNPDMLILLSATSVGFGGWFIYRSIRRRGNG